MVENEYSKVKVNNEIEFFFFADTNAK